MKLSRDIEFTDVFYGSRNVAQVVGKVRALIALLTKPSERFVSGSEGHFPEDERNLDQLA